MNLRVLSALRGLFYFKRRALKDRKDFCKDYLLNFPLTLRVLSALRGFILLTAGYAETAKASVMVFNSKPLPIIYWITASLFLLW